MLTQETVAIAIIIIIIKVYLSVYMDNSYNMYFELPEFFELLVYSTPATLFHNYTLDIVVARTSPPPIT